nr:unknown [Zea mays]
MVVPSPARNATPTSSSPESTTCWFSCDNKSSKQLQLQRGGPSLAERQQPRAMLACRAITERVKRPKEEEQATSVPEVAVVADVKGKEYNSVERLTRVNCRSDFIIWRSLFDACCRLCKLFNCQELKLTDSRSALTLIDAQVVFEKMQQSATSVSVPQDAFNMFCSKTSSSKQVARAIFINPEHDLYPEIFHLEQLISGKEDTTNNFSRGYYTIGKGMVLVANNLGDDLLARRSEIKQPWPPPQELACLGLNIMVVLVFLATSDLHAVTYIYAQSLFGILVVLRTAAWGQAAPQGEGNVRYPAHMVFAGPVS